MPVNVIGSKRCSREQHVGVTWAVRRGTDLGLCMMQTMQSTGFDISRGRIFV